MSAARAGLAVLACCLCAPHLAGAQGSPPFPVDVASPAAPGSPATPGDRGEPGVAADGSGSFVVTWEEWPLGAPARVLARRFDAAGQPLTDPLEVVAGGPSGDPVHPVVSAALDGSFVVVWEAGGQVLARRFGPLGQPLTGPARVGASAPGGGFDAVSYGNGGFAVVLEVGNDFGAESDAPDSGGPFTLLAQRFYPSGAPRGLPITLASLVPGDLVGGPAPPRIARAGDDSLVVTWQQGGVAADVFARTFRLPPPSGQASGRIAGWTSSPANLLLAGLQRRAAAAPDGLGDLGVVWESGPPRVAIDLALCLDGSASTSGGSGGDAADTFLLELEGAAEAVEDPRVTPADGSLRLSVLLFGAGGIVSLEEGRTIDSAATAASVAADLRAAAASRPAGDSPVDDCLCAAAALLTGTPAGQICPETSNFFASTDGRPGSSRKDGQPEPPGSEQDFPRKIIGLATDGVPSVLQLLPDGRLVSDGSDLTSRIRDAAARARQAGVLTIDAFRLPVAGSVLDFLRPLGLPAASAQQVDLSAAVFPATPGSERGWVAEVAGPPDLAGAIGRMLAGELTAESGIFARFLRASGGPAPEIQVNSNVAGAQAEPDIAAGAGGGWLVAWEDHELGGIEAQEFAADGSPVGAETELSEEGGVSLHPRLAPLAGGGFAAVWQRWDPVSGQFEVEARILGTTPDEASRSRKRSERLSRGSPAPLH